MMSCWDICGVSRLPFSAAEMQAGRQGAVMFAAGRQGALMFAAGVLRPPTTIELDDSDDGELPVAEVKVEEPDDSDDVGELPVAEVKVEDQEDPDLIWIPARPQSQETLREAIMREWLLDRRFAETLQEREVEDKAQTLLERDERAIRAKHEAGDSDDPMDTRSSSSSSHREPVVPPSLCPAGPAPVFVFGNVFFGGNVAAVIVQNAVDSNNYNQVHIGRP